MRIVTSSKCSSFLCRSNWSHWKKAFLLCSVMPLYRHRGSSYCLKRWMAALISHVLNFLCFWLSALSASFLSLHTSALSILSTSLPIDYREIHKQFVSSIFKYTRLSFHDHRFKFLGFWLYAHAVCPSWRVFFLTVSTSSNIRPKVSSYVIRWVLS